MKIRLTLLYIYIIYFFINYNYILESMIKSKVPLSGALLKVKDFFLSCIDLRNINNQHDPLISYIYIIFIY